jgi:AcrR family transcriptional regulator
VARQPAADTRDRILDTAGRLFYEHGVQAVGVQQIIDECGCGKSLLYREFPSKDDLVVAYLQRFRDGWTELVQEHVEPLSHDPAAQLVALARLVATQAGEPGYRGCAFRNCYEELAEDHPARALAGRHITGVHEQIQAIVGRMDVAGTRELADRICLIIEGIYAAAALPGGQRAAQTGVTMVWDLAQRISEST